MAESQKKHKKGRKKSESSEAIPILAKDHENCTPLNCESKKNDNQRLLDKTFEKDKELSDIKSEVTDDASGKKKKKSKKKMKDASGEKTKETSGEKSGSLLNYSENGIHLVNHPEISVTISETCISKSDEIKPTVNKIPPLNDVKSNNPTDKDITPSTETADANNTAKKKKKKKKKNSSDSLPVTSASSNENTIVTPTYTKVVTSDNTCVLVVNNEKRPLDTSPLENSCKNNKVPDSSINFSMPSEKQFGNVLLTKNFSPDTNIQFSNSVSIFPVLSNGNSNTSEKQTVRVVNIEASQKPDTKTSEISLSETVDESKPTKSQLKAERRAKQEAQRAAKLAKSNTKVDNVSNSANQITNNASNEKLPKEISSKVVETPSETVTAKLLVEKESLHKVKLFSHLPQLKKFDSSAKIHPAVLEIGFKYNNGIICGSNARCIALLEALTEVIQDFVPQPDRNFCRDLESNIQSYLTYLSNCRPLSVSMLNAVRFLKHEMNQIPSDIDADEIKNKLCDFICNFVRVEIVLAKEAIADRASYKITDGDVILVLGFSSVVRDVLCKAYEMKKIFRVIVVDTRPKQEGLKMLRSLVRQGLQCSYISINAVSYIMKEVTKFIIGAHALLANGCVMSRLGTKQIALVASTYGVPVFVCCETYKFCERVLTDSFVHNELGEPDDIINTSLILNDSLKNWRELPLLQPLNLLYDLTTPNLIAEIVTEKGTLPCTSVPVFLRVRFAGLSQ